MNDQNPLAGYQLPPLAWLRAFEAAARHQSFTLAASELSLTQAAVSHQVRSLEKHLGVTLFERLPRSLRLTEKGAAYLPPLRNSFDELAAATAGLFGPVGKRTLSIRGPVSFIALWLAPRLSDFRARWPDISLRVSTIVWAPTLQDETADIDIRFGDGNWPGYRSSLILSHKVIPLCIPGMAEGDNDAARLQWVMNHSLLIHDTGYENLWQKLARQAGLAFAPSAGMNIDTTISALEMASAGIGPAIVIESLAESYIKSGRLVQFVDMALPIEEAHYIVQPEGQKRLKPEATLFRDWLLQKAAL
ncbi:LysR family transcriptional regulator [Rhizobium sp. KVB221]|uniref:LysR family transcriptional regulator n=1 Tax=Rhizobium setariae TaxID=2801340 RepID=A0A937CK04_9HYPH|nr:LysR substrate-binding domain-containing protein [Rhizobium setariae]MBL0371660.1 LysR family transcriptional regulator [Rhizobium setariae]